MEAEDEIEDILGQVPAEDLEQATTIAEARRLAEDFQPLLAARLPEWLNATMAWVKTGFGYALSLDKGHVGIVVNLLGQGAIKIHRPREALGRWVLGLTNKKRLTMPKLWCRTCSPNASCWSTFRRNGCKPGTDLPRSSWHYAGCEGSESRLGLLNRTSRRS